VIKRSSNGLQKLFSTVVPVGVLSWALAMLTASYLGYAKIDAAFISSLVTSVLAIYGINHKDKDDDHHPGSKPGRTPKPPGTP